MPADTIPSIIKVLLVEDHPMFRERLASIIAKRGDMCVCGEADNVNDAIACAEATQPNIAIVDITLRGSNGLDFLKDLKAREINLPVLVLSMHDEAIYAERVLRAGARGYIMKEAGGDNLLAAIRQIIGGEVYLSPRMSARIFDHLSSRRPRGSSSPIQNLTDREFEVFQLIGHGKSTRDVAVQLHLSPKTVDVHRGHIKAKLDLGNATALVRHAVRWVESAGSEDHGAV